VGRRLHGSVRFLAVAVATANGGSHESATCFTWTPDPPPPFDVLFIAPGGVYMEPVLIERLGGVIEITVTPL
jgi:hypothetical protein